MTVRTGAALVGGTLAFLLMAANRTAQGSGTETRPPPPKVKAAVKSAVKSAVKGVVASAQGAAPGAAPGQPASASDPAAAAVARIATLRRKVLRDEDFVESDDANRDPFRSYLRLFVGKEAPRLRTVPAIFEKFALEELLLIAVISGDANPRAMFRDPGGLGQAIKRGDYLSKSGARVTKILSDRVILELTEMMPSGESRALEKAILVNPGGPQK